MRGCSERENVKLYSHIFFLNWYFSFVYCLDIICTHQLPLENTTRQHTGTETDTDTDYSQKLLMEVNAYFLLSYFWILFHYQRMKCLTWHIAIYYAVFIACLQKNPTKQIVFFKVWNTSQNKTMSIMSKLYFRCWFPTLTKYSDHLLIKKSSVANKSMHANDYWMANFKRIYYLLS